LFLPGSFSNARKQTLEREVSKANTTDAKFLINSLWSSAVVAPCVNTGGKLQAPFDVTPFDLLFLALFEQCFFAQADFLAKAIALFDHGCFCH
jgi:hypothetical protein